jgi:predicted nuclease of predicted toxin-antitoxin system
MKFLVDAQLPPALCRWLEVRGGDALHVTDVFSGEIADAEIAAFAVAECRIIVSKDDDFAFRHNLPDLQIVWPRIGNASNRRLAAWLDLRWTEIVGALKAGERIVEVR